MSQVKVVASDESRASRRRMMWPLALPVVCPPVVLGSTYARGLGASAVATVRDELLVSVQYISPVAGLTAVHSGRSIRVAPSASAARRVLMSTSTWLANG